MTADLCAGGRLSVLHVSTADLGGGAERVAWTLFQAHQARGADAYLAVRTKRSADPRVLEIPNESRRSGWWRGWHRLEKWALRRGVRFMPRLCRLAAAPAAELSRVRGREDFDFPGSRLLLELPPRQPDVVHCHNLHGNYFDLRVLPDLSRRVPVILTLQDAWLLSGHCIHSFDCERWKTGCGECPDLSIPVEIPRDATAFNWRRKQAIYAASRLHVATSCRWMLRKVEQSMLAPGVVESRVIPNGVDLAVFRPADRPAVRGVLDIPADARVVLFAANGIRQNPWKDYRTLGAAAARVAEGFAGRLLFVALGEEAPPERIGRAEIRFVPFQREPGQVARYYQAADVYAHAARADTFPNTILEALACGTPVVATAVCGIPEQIRGLRHPAASPQESSHPPERATGLLVPPGDAAALAAALGHLLGHDSLRERLGENAHADACRRFGLDLQAEAYLEWYQDLQARPGALRLAQARGA